MKQRVILSVNFSQAENSLLEQELHKIEVAVTLNAISSATLSLKTTSLSQVSLVLIKLNGEASLDSGLLREVKKQFTHFPIIIITDETLNNKVSAIFNLKNVIDIRTLKPVFLVAKSIAREITAQYSTYTLHQVKAQLKNDAYRFDAFLDNTEDGVALIHDGVYISSNRAYKRIFTIPEDDDITNTTVLEFNTPTTCPIDSDSTVEENLNTSLDSLPNDTIVSVLIQTRDKKSFITTIYKSHCFVNDQLCTQLLIHNPDAWSDIEKGFTDLRTFDHDTGLYNKRFTFECIDKELESDEPHGSLAVILIDGFRSVRQQYIGAHIEDITRSVASAINNLTTDCDILAKYGEAVFTLFSAQQSRSEFLLNCQEILTEINDTLFGDDTQYIKLSLSMGVSFIGTRVTTCKQLISQADNACDKASSGGGNQINVFDSVTTPLTVIIDEEKNTQIIQSALEQERLHPLYQPIVDLSEENIENYAVLLRILDDNNEHIPPDNFILTAEKTGLISQLDEWVLKNTIEQIRESSRQGVKRKFFISLSSITYQNPEFIETLVKEIELNNIDPSLLVFQINFSDISTEPDSVKKFISIIKSDCGCQLAFDQTGFSQITDQLLKEYPVDYVKIDGSFSKDLFNNKDSQQTIRNLIAVTHKNGVKTIAKSVENSNTLAILWNLGISAVQGYFLQRPSDSMNFDFTLND